jgi:hypothetical protein
MMTASVVRAMAAMTAAMTTAMTTAMATAMTAAMATAMTAAVSATALGENEGRGKCCRCGNRASCGKGNQCLA